MSFIKRYLVRTKGEKEKKKENKTNKKSKQK